MVLLVASAHSAEYLYRLLFGGLLHGYRLEPAFKRAVLFDEPAVFLGRCGSDKAYFPPGKLWLQDIRGVYRALGGSGADYAVTLVDEQNYILTAGRLIYYAAEALLKVAAVLRSGKHCGQVKGVYALPLKSLRNGSCGYPLREALDYRRFSYARVPDQAGIILTAPQKHPDKPLSFLLASYYRVELSKERKFRQVSAVLRQRREFRTPVLVVLLELRLGIAPCAHLPGELNLIHAEVCKYLPAVTLTVENYRPQEVFSPRLSLILAGGIRKRVLHEPAAARSKVVQSEPGRSALAYQSLQPAQDLVPAYSVFFQENR